MAPTTRQQRGKGKGIRQLEETEAVTSNEARHLGEDYNFEADEEVPAWAKYMMMNLKN